MPVEDVQQIVWSATDAQKVETKMDITSPPAFTEETVTDFDIMYVGGLRDSLTLRKGDTFVVTLAQRTLTFKCGGETITANWDNILTYRRQERVIKTMHPPVTPVV